MIGHRPVIMTVQLKMDQLPPLRALRRFLDELVVFQQDTPAEERPNRPHIVLEEVSICGTADSQCRSSAASLSMCMASVPADGHGANLCASVLPRMA